MLSIYFMFSTLHRYQSVSRVCWNIAARQAGRMAWVRDPGAASLCFISCTTSSSSTWCPHQVSQLVCRWDLTCPPVDKIRRLAREMTAPGKMAADCLRREGDLKERTDKLPLHMQVNTTNSSTRVPYSCKNCRHACIRVCASLYALE